jgi:hypothetical protein
VSHEQLKMFLFSEDEIERYLGEVNKTINDKEELLASHRDEQSGLTEELDKIIKLYLERQLPKDSVAKHYLHLERRLKQVEDRVANRDTTEQGVRNTSGLPSGPQIGSLTQLGGRPMFGCSTVCVCYLIISSLCTLLEINLPNSSVTMNLAK